MMPLPRLRVWGRAIALGLAAALARPAAAQQAGNTQPGSIILYCQPGTPAADVQAITAPVSPVSVTPLRLKDCYLVTLQAAHANPLDSATAVATMKQSPEVRNCHIMRLARYTQTAGSGLTPNDPMYSQQWSLPLINMPLAWTLQKGKAPVTVAWIDTGYEPTHQDAVGQFSPGSYNFGDNNTNIAENGTGADAGHGISTSGIAIAITNNGLGIAGIDGWGGIKCFACKLDSNGQPATGGSEAEVINAYNYVATNKTQYDIVALNCSFAFEGVDNGDPSDPLYVASKQVSDAGIVFCASAGNEATTDTTTNSPAGLPFVVSVSATDRNKLLTYYSSYGKVDMAAPGGSQLTDTDPNGILVLQAGSAYGFEQGTSFSAPHVTAVAALLMCTPGLTRQQAISALETTADRSLITGAVPDPKYGYGFLNAYAALSKVSVIAQIVSPQGINPTTGQASTTSSVVAPVQTFKPSLQFNLVNVPPANVSISVDGNQIPSAEIVNSVTSGNATGANPQYTLSVRYQFPTTAPFQHTVQITGTNPASGVSATDTRQFTITPQVIPAGLNFISIPYYESASDSPTGSFRDVAQFLGSNVTTYRWIPANASSNGVTTVVGQYAAYGPGIASPLSQYATFRPPDVTTMLASPGVGQPTDIRPVGIGYFVNSPAGITIATNGVDFPGNAVVIPLHEGWNMVGDPFTYAVLLSSTEIQNTAGNSVPFGQATDAGLVLPEVYQLVNGDYQFESLPGALLNPWQGYWLFVPPANPAKLNMNTVLNLIVTPTQATGVASAAGRAAATRAASTGPVVAPTGGWTVRLAAQSGSLLDTHNYVGMAPGATAGEDRTKVPKPPRMSPYVALNIVRTNGRAAAYAEDIEPQGSSATWNLQLSSDQKNASVTVTWPDTRSMPRTYDLVLKDSVTGKSMSLRRTASYTFNLGTANSRAFTLTAQRQTYGGRAVISNVSVNPPRGAGRAAGIYEVSYTISADAQVEVSILKPGGTVVAQVGTGRAVASGQNVASWNGRDSAGRMLPAGPYNLQIMAVDNSGNETRIVQPLLITGR